MRKGIWGALFIRGGRRGARGLERRKEHEEPLQPSANPTSPKGLMGPHPNNYENKGSWKIVAFLLIKNYKLLLEVKGGVKPSLLSLAVKEGLENLFLMFLNNLIFVNLENHY